jgi:effector-binding domain-containing protein
MSYHDEFLIVEKEIGNVIEIAESIALWKMPQTIEQNLSTIYAYLQSQKQESGMGMPYTRYVDINWEEQMNKSIWQIFVDIFKYQWDLRMGIPTQNQVDSHKSMQADFIPKRKYLETIHYGPYQKLGSTYKALYHYAKSKSIVLENTSFEFYQNNPKEVKPHELQTTVLVAIKEV